MQRERSHPVITTYDTQPSIVLAEGKVAMGKRHTNAPYSNEQRNSGRKMLRHSLNVRRSKWLSISNHSPSMHLLRACSFLGASPVGFGRTSIARRRGIDISYGMRTQQRLTTNIMKNQHGK